MAMSNKNNVEGVHEGAVKSVGLPTSEFDSRNRRENGTIDIMFIFQLFDYRGSVACP